MFEIDDIELKQENLNDGGLAFDEIEIRAGLVYLKSSGRLIGLTDGEIQAKNIDVNDTHHNSKKELPLTLPKKVVQIIYVSTDGRISFPLAHYATTTLSGSQAFTIISACNTEVKMKAKVVLYL